MTGAIVVDLGTGELEAARAALARAVASGALGVGRAVRRESDGFVFDGGRLDVTGDGRVTWSIATRAADRMRAVEATLLAAMTAMVATLGWAQPIYVALPLGAVAGVLWALTRIGGDRGELSRRVRALVASLPVLVDARRQ